MIFVSLSKYTIRYNKTILKLFNYDRKNIILKHTHSVCLCNNCRKVDLSRNTEDSDKNLSIFLPRMHE